MKWRKHSEPIHGFRPPKARATQSTAVRTIRRALFEQLEGRSLMAADLATVATEELFVEANQAEVQFMTISAMVDDMSPKSEIGSTEELVDDGVVSDELVKFISMTMRGGAEDVSKSVDGVTAGMTDIDSTIVELSENTDLTDTPILVAYTFGETDIVEADVLDEIEDSGIRTLTGSVSLEDDELMSATGLTVWLWNNSAMPADVNGDATVTALDVLMVIDALNTYGAVPTTELNSLAASSRNHWDINGDSFVTPLDALLLANFFNNGGILDLGVATLTEANSAPAFARIMDPSLVEDDTDAKRVVAPEDLQPEDLQPEADEMLDSEPSAAMSLVAGDYLDAGFADEELKESALSDL